MVLLQINLKIDPEGAKVALTADFPSISECKPFHSLGLV